MSDYTKHLASQLGIREASIKPVDMDASEVDPDELKMGVEDETEHTDDPALAQKIALHHLKKHGDYYSKLKNAGLEETMPAAIDRIMSPTAIQTPVIGMAIRGSNTGGLPSGADQTGIQSKTPTGRLGGYEPIQTAKQNSELVDKTPQNDTINSDTPIAADAESDNVGDSHPHQTQNNTDEPPQAVTGASDDSDPALTLKAALPKMGIEDGGEESDADKGEEVRQEMGVNENRIGVNVLDEVRNKLSEKAAKGKMNSKEAELFSTITEVLAKRGLGLEQKLFGKKSMLETANVPIKEGHCEDYPCCGHEDGGCPNEDGSFNCTCGAKLPKDSRYSICQGCLARGSKEDREDQWDDRMEEYKSMLATNEVKVPVGLDKNIDKNIAALKKRKEGEKAKQDDKKNQDKLDKQVRRDDLA